MRHCIQINRISTRPKQTLTITSALLSHAHNPLGFLLFMLMGFTFIEPVSKSIKYDPQTACGHQTDWWALHLCFVVDVILKYENLSGKKNTLLLERPCQTRQSNKCQTRQSNKCQTRQSNKCQTRQSNKCQTRQSNKCQTRQSNKCQTRLIALAIMYTTFKTDLPWSLRLLNDSTSSSMIST